MVLVSRGLGHRGHQAVHYAKADGSSGKNVNRIFVLFRVVEACLVSLRCPFQRRLRMCVFLDER
jgi:hypothetical protein